MSTFAELTPQLEMLGAVMLQGLAEAGLPCLQSRLYPTNMSSEWIAANRERIPAMKRAGYIGNDGYAMQNLMESFARFQPPTPELHRVQVPTLIMNGEFEFFTPRECHETIRREVKNSRLLIMPRAYHAFTLEMQTKLTLFICAAKNGNLMFHAGVQWMPQLNLVQQFLLSQYAREPEAVTLLSKTARWSPSPLLAIQAGRIAAPLTLACARLMLPPGRCSIRRRPTAASRWATPSWRASACCR